MNEVKHTPGPFFTTCPHGGTIYVEARLRGSTIQEVAAIGPTETPEQQQANAKLFAAAPDLLAAAMKVLSGLNARIDAAVENRTATPVFDGIADMHDAINKATQ